MRVEARTVVLYLREHGKVTDPSGRVTSILREAIIAAVPAAASLSPSSLSGILTDLERGGWIKREINGRRTYGVELTACGEVDPIPPVSTPPARKEPDVPPRVRVPRESTSLLARAGRAPVTVSASGWYVIDDDGDARVVRGEYVAKYRPPVQSGPHVTALDARTALAELARDGEIAPTPHVDTGANRDLSAELDSLPPADVRLVADLIERLRSR